MNFWAIFDEIIYLGNDRCGTVLVRKGVFVNNLKFQLLIAFAVLFSLNSYGYSYQLKQNPMRLNGLKTEQEKKGVYIYFDEPQLSILATESGVVDHVGALKNYGNVVMFELKNGDRHIYLGSFNPSVKKGDSIKIGQNIGVTVDSKCRKLYFEVRQNNKVVPIKLK
jgi:murein DD-endopeptidase MepM/ murein hydrolase activator NlpD